MKSLDAFLPAYEFSTRHTVSVNVPDPVSGRRFGHYWRIVRPFSGLIRMRVLQAAKRRAEAV
jgi:hypothetical protein